MPMSWECGSGGARRWHPRAARPPTCEPQQRRARRQKPVLWVTRTLPAKSAHERKTLNLPGRGYRRARSDRPGTGAFLPSRSESAGSGSAAPDGRGSATDRTDGDGCAGRARRTAGRAGWTCSGERRSTGVETAHRATPVYGPRAVEAPCGVRAFAPGARRLGTARTAAIGHREGRCCKAEGTFARLTFGKGAGVEAFARGCERRWSAEPDPCA